jgi:glyoxylase-like metal-dependent hydrolase (beta-lactamase superfamily II)
MEKSTVTLQLFASGYCKAEAHIENPISGRGQARFYAVWALWHIPEVGYVMFDTGYSPHFIEATRAFPERLYRWATPIVLAQGETAKEILASQNILPTDIRYIIISHFHADHISALRDFPQARFVCTKASLAEVQTLRGFSAVRKGILHKLLPTDFYERVIPIELLADSMAITEEGLTLYSLFQSPHFQLVSLAGHARGMLGFVYAQDSKKIFFGTDAAWSYETYQKNILPHRIVKLFFDSWQDFVQTQARIRAFEKRNPHFEVLFTHCPKTLEKILACPHDC